MLGPVPNQMPTEDTGTEQEITPLDHTAADNGEHVRCLPSQEGR